MAALTLVIRRYTSEDFEAIFVLHRSVLEATGAYLDLLELDSDLSNIKGVYFDNHGEFLVGLVNNSIVAMGALRRIDDDQAEIKRMRVDREFQNRGYGQQLLHALEAAAITLGYKRLCLDTTTLQHAARHLYEKNGYAVIETRTTSYGFDLVLYQKQIDKANVEIELEPVVYEAKSILRNLLELYEYDFSEHNGRDVDESGLFGYRYLDHYWTEEGRFAYFIRCEGRLAGFALVRTLETYYCLSEFFVLRKYRSKGMGRQAAIMLFDRLPGRWEVSQEASNTGAQQFWKQVIGEYTKGAFEETKSDIGLSLLFDSTKA